MIAALCVASGAAAALVLAANLRWPLALLWRLLGAVAGALVVSAILLGPAKQWLPVGIAAGFFASLLQAAWELLVVAGDAQRRPARPPASSRW